MQINPRKIVSKEQNIYDYKVYMCLQKKESYYVGVNPQTPSAMHLKRVAGMVVANLQPGIKQENNAAANAHSHQITPENASLLFNPCAPLCA